jgi:hypothetical protein
MKTKFFIALIAVVTLTFAAGNTFAQMTGAQKSTTGTTSMQANKGSDDSQGLKPGASLGGGKYVAIVVTPEEAAKKYPQNGKAYPNGMDAQLANDIGSATHSGFIKSPYSSRVYDCRKIGKGTLLLDDSAKKVFVRP